jgi:hypothetical protein
VARANGGALGLYGKTFGEIEANGLEEWHSGIKKELLERTYKLQSLFSLCIPNLGGS